MVSDQELREEILSAGVDDLLKEVEAKNHVRVVVFRAVKKPFQRTMHERVLDELNPSIAQLPSLVRQDHFRMLAGRKPIYLPELLRRVGGDLVSVTANLRTTVGINFVADALSGTSQPAVADYIALSNNTATPAAGDSSSTAPWSTAQATDPAPGGATGEYTALGLARKQATYAHTGGATSYTMAATWTASSTITSVRLAGLFGGAGKTAQGSGGTNILFLENTFTATTLANGDQLSLTWTVNI